MEDIKRWLPGVLISFALIAVILHFVDFSALLNAIRSANYFILAAVMPLSILGMSVRAKVCQTLLCDRPAYREVLYSVGEGYLLNNLLPFRLGEPGRAFLLSQKSGIPFSVIIPTMVIERIVDLAFSATILLAALPSLLLVAGAEGLEWVGYIVGLAVAFGLLMMCVLVRNMQWILDQFNKRSARWPSIQRIGGSFFESLLAGLGVFTDGWLFIRFMFWMTIDWAIAVVAYSLIILAFFPNAQLSWGLCSLSAATFGGAIPSLPGGVGTVEGAIVGALTPFTHDQSTSFAVALAFRFYGYFNSGVIGGVGFLCEGQTLSRIYRQMMAYRLKERH